MPYANFSNFHEIIKAAWIEKKTSSFIIFFNYMNGNSTKVLNVLFKEEVLKNK